MIYCNASFFEEDHTVNYQHQEHLIINQFYYFSYLITSKFQS